MPPLENIGYSHKLKTSSGASGAWVIRFIALLIVCQILLLFEELRPFRFVIRTAGFGLSLFLFTIFFMRPLRLKAHPAQKMAVLVMMILMLQFLHPQGGSLVASIFHILLYLAVLAPLFWVPKLKIDIKIFRQLVFILWGFHTLSSVFGILQVYFPDRFQAQLSTVIESQGEGYVNSLRYELSSGQEIFRPMGLTDTPGGAAISGFYAMMFGLALLLTHKHNVLKLFCMISMVLGVACMVFSQVRSVLVLAGVFLLTFAFIFLKEKKFKNLAKVLVGGTIIVVVGVTWALTVGGESVRERLLTLVQDKPTGIYYQERGHFLEATIKELAPHYPLGAGLARWGMLSYYFNTPDALWAEIQITGWLYDGGIPLIVVYSSMLMMALWMAMKMAKMRRLSPVGTELNLWASMLVAYDIGSIAITFNYPLFIGQGGVEFWLFNAVLYVVFRSHRLRRYLVKTETA